MRKKTSTVKNISTPSGIVATLFGLQWPRGGKDGRWKREGARDNHGQAIIICLHLLFYPLSPVDTANGIASLCHSKSHFCPPRPCLCWQSERMRERGKKEEEKSRQRHFSTWLFVNFCVLVKTRGSARLLGWLESCQAGVEVWVWEKWWRRATEEVLHVAVN